MVSATTKPHPGSMSTTGKRPGLCTAATYTLKELIERAEERWPGCSFDDIKIVGAIKGEFWIYLDE